MSWLPIDQGLASHRKVWHLRKAPPDPGAQHRRPPGSDVAVGSRLSRRWPGGRVRLLDDEKAAGWTGEPGALVDAFVEAGLLDRDGDKLNIHNWENTAARSLTPDARPRSASGDTETRLEVTRTERGRNAGRTVQIEKKKREIEKKDTHVASDESTVFEYWKEVMGKSDRTRLDSPRRTAIKRALSVFSVDECKAAIDGCRNTPHNMGDNDRAERYNDLTLIFRDASHWERFIDEEPDPETSRLTR